MLWIKHQIFVIWKNRCFLPFLGKQSQKPFGKKWSCQLQKSPQKNKKFKICHISCSLVYPLQFLYNICVFVSQISTSHYFISIWLIYMIFMRDREGVLFDVEKKRVKWVQKGWNLKFYKKVKILKKSSFFQSLPFVYPFYPLCIFL